MCGGKLRMRLSVVGDGKLIENACRGRQHVPNGYLRFSNEDSARQPNNIINLHAPVVQPEL